MKLVYTNTKTAVRPGDVVRGKDGQFATVAGWTPQDLLMHVWLKPEQVGILTFITAYSVHYFNCEWQP